MKGKLIVIEGSDGSGKSTQLELLKKSFQEKKIPFQSLRFPQYTKNFFGKTLAKYLRGEMGSLRNINPYLISMVYAMDRAEARDQMYRWLNHGKHVLLDRYVTSNMAHQCGRLPKKERNKFLKWVDDLEYKINNVPREDIVIFLYVPYAVSSQLLMNTNKINTAHMKGQAKDMVEQNKDYLQKSVETYLWLAQRYEHWVQITCVDEKGNIRSRQYIHEEIKKVLAEKLHI